MSPYRPTGSNLTGAVVDRDFDVSMERIHAQSLYDAHYAASLVGLEVDQPP